MAQVVFLDTNVILDYLETRDEAVSEIVERLLELHKSGKVILATSVFNIAESIDKEFDIHFGEWGLRQRMSFEEIQKSRRDWRKFKDVSENHRHKVRERIEAFALKNGVIIYSIPPGSEQYEQIYELIYKYQLQSQDALIVTAALVNDTTYFLSNDSELIVKTRDILDGYDLHEPGSRNAFRSHVLEAI